MIKSFRHSGIASYFLHGKKNGIQPHHAQKLSKLLGRLNVSTQADDMNLPGWGMP
jgi:proteic killer suppression protein